MLSTRDTLDAWSHDFPRYTPTLDLGNLLGCCFLSCNLSFKMYIVHNNRWKCLKCCFVLFWWLLNHPYEVRYARSNIGKLFNCERTWRNTNTHNSMSMGEVQIVCALSKTVLDLSTVVLVYSSAIPFWWCEPVPQNVTHWS